MTKDEVSLRLGVGDEQAVYELNITIHGSVRYTR